MSKRKTNLILVMFCKKQIQPMWEHEDVDDPPVSPLPTQLIEDQKY